MSKPNTILDEPLTLGQESIRTNVVCNGKAFLCAPLLVGFVFGVLYSPFRFVRSEVMEPAINMRGFAHASPMSMSCPRAGPSMSVNAMQHVLRKNGIPSSPMERAALAQFAATRDVSMAAEAKEEFLKLDPATQAKLKKLSKEVTVRAADLTADEIAGVTEPLGFWDPAGFSKDGEPERLAAFRRAELKHGRVCMLSALGIIVAERYHPIFDDWGEGSFVSAVATHFTETAAKNFWPAFWIMAAGHELATSLVDYEGKDYADYNFDPLNLKPEDPDELLELQNKELNNGRLAMVSAAGIIAQELVTGKNIF